MVKRQQPPKPPVRQAPPKPIRRSGDFWESWNRAGEVLSEIGDDAWDLV